MRNKLYQFIFIAAIPFFGLDNPTGNRMEHLSEFATCTGKDPCSACSNCSSCKHCTANRSCGVCKKKNQGKKASTPTSGQCQATTKKGTQCSRNASSGKYCWQHQE